MTECVMYLWDFRPSSSVDEGLDEAYTNAENQVDNEDDCGTTYADCPFSIYDYITEQYEWELHRVVGRWDDYVCHFV